MEDNQELYTSFYLPRYFKILGVVIILFSLLVLIFAALIKSYLYFLPSAHIILMYNRIAFVIGLSLVIFSKEKNEDKATNEIRFKALVFSLAASVLLLIILEIINVLNNNIPINAVDFMIIEMCIYYVFFRLKKQVL